jgi:hypothetical protein
MASENPPLIIPARPGFVLERSGAIGGGGAWLGFNTLAFFGDKNFL